ncbi:NACHT domain-containing protein [Amycolatopsis sp. NPDC051758]|uniref:NACHT domain-containing protein n=1 Tax=Amycolatopsis sp. NPDC051758 TaxID=3363935 RepID=UPI00379203BB
MSLEVTAIALTTAVMKAAAKIWLGDRAIAADTSAKAFDLLEKQVTGANDRRKLKLLFTNLESRVVDQLLPFLDVEFRGLPENERAAAVEAARATFDRAALTDDDLFATDLDAGFLRRYLLRTVPGVPREFLLSTDATELYHRVVRECCAYLVQVTSALPKFQPGALVQILRRETEILETVRNVLEAMPERRHPDDFAADFRRQVVAALDRMELFGADLTGPTRLYRLSVAYLSLSVSAHHDGVPVDRIEQVLPHATRILVRGEAGSGKTTVLHWLAVQCASRQLTGATGWDDLEPFLLRLRRFTRSELPSPERFLDEVGRHIADEMPSGWVQQRLRNGQAVVLVDGIDELPADRRSEVRRWLGELISAFPRARYVVTTRPAAVERDWLAAEDFTEVSLQPMTPRDVRTFVERWHSAMPNDDALVARRDDLIAAIGTRSALRRLAETPLLCALLCALHHTRNGHLPHNRMELYDVALRMLLDRRDVERRVPSDVRLSLTEKLVLLRHLAYWMVRNGFTDVPAEAAEARLAVKLSSMGQVDATPYQVFRHLLDRGGVLREPVPGRIDFVHRSFGDYLAAEAAVEEDDIGVLERNAHRDDWRDVVVMAAGHARPEQRTTLIERLLVPDSSPDNDMDSETLKRSLVALACLETSPELRPDLRAAIKLRTSSLVPPETFEVAERLAAAGEFVLDLLAGPVPADLESAAATVRAAALIGGPAALELLTGYSGQVEPIVVEELVKARERFDPAEFAERVLADCVLPNGCLSVSHLAMLAGLEHLRFLDTLIVDFADARGSLDFVRRLPQLRDLRVAGFEGFDLSELSDTPLTHVALLQDVRLNKHTSHTSDLSPEMFGPSSVDVSPLRRVPRLARLTAEVETHGWSHLSDLRDLRRLQLSHVKRSDQLTELTALGERLRALELHRVIDLRDLSILSFLEVPEALQFDCCDELRNISQLTQWSDTLTSLRMHRCPVEDWTPLARLTRLQKLRLDSTAPIDFSLLSELRSLRTLWLGGRGQVDLAPLARRAKLTVWVGRDTKLFGEDQLGPDCKVKRF